MSENRIYRILEHPWLYRLQRTLLASGADSTLLDHFGRITANLPENARTLDVGCGPSSRLWPLGLHPIGLDYSPSYVRSFHSLDQPAVIGSSERLPFPNDSFDAVFSIGVFHHLPDALVGATVKEMRRICRPSGLVVVFDAVLPEPAWRRPAAYTFRRLDRGRHMRYERGLRSLIGSEKQFDFERITYTRTGYEGLIAVGRPM